jgi:protein involved in polysaccharide export with SLBB domain
LKAFDKVTVRNLPGWEPLQVVSVRGEVIYPGQYSLASRSERISSLIKRMGGLKPEAFPEGATMTRRGDIVAMSPGGAAGAAAAGLAAAQEIALNLAGALENPGGDDDLILKDGDDIYIPGNPGTVEVRGAVKRPMILQHKAGLRIKDYVELCGGYLESADKANLAVYAANKAAQRIKRGLFSSSNPEVAAGSTIEVPFIGEATRLEAVEVKGAVVRPAVVQYIKGAKLGYYLNLCGGYSKEADVEKVAIHLPDGGLLVKQENVAFNPAVPPGSIIVVTTKTNK